MGYQIGSILAISPNDTHSYFAYFLPTDRLEYIWINDWVEKNFMKIADSLMPSGVVIAPTSNRRMDYLRDFDEVVKNGRILHSGFPFIVFSKKPIHTWSEQSKAIILNLAACENQQVLGSVLDILVAVCKKDRWNEIERLPNLAKDLSSEYDSHYGGWSWDFSRSVELKPNIFDATTRSSTPIPRKIPTIARRKISKIVGVLFLMSDPTDASRLRLGQEFREIQEKLKLAQLREQFKLELPQLSLRPADIAQALLDTQPQIVHFSGHGTSTGELCFENQLGQIQLVQPDALAALFEQFSNQIDCVLLNACYSEIQAKAIAEHIKYVIGMNQAIGDKAAIAFAIGFYQALGAGRTIEEAYKLGCVQIRLQGIPEHLTPVLIKSSHSPNNEATPVREEQLTGPIKVVETKRETINVYVVITKTGTSYLIEVALDSLVRHTEEGLVETLKLPQKLENNLPIAYHLYSKSSSKILNNSVTFRQNDVKDGDTLSLLIEAMAG